MYNASQDSLHKKINKDGTETSSTALLYGSIENLKKLHASDSSALGKLQKLVDKLTISATILSTSTSGTTSSSTVIAARDTVRSKKDSLIYVYPEYTLKRDSSKWEDISAFANKDSFVVHYSIFNEYAFKQDWQKQGTGIKKILSQRIPIVSVTNLNPHTQTRELQSFSVKPKKHSRLKHFVMGGMVGVIGTYIVLKK
jgi:hypothetical protein